MSISVKSRGKKKYISVKVVPDLSIIATNYLKRSLNNCRGCNMMPLVDRYSTGWPLELLINVVAAT